MWDESRQNNVIMGRPNSGSEVVVMDDRVMEAANRAQPPVANLSVTKSSRVHIGPKFVSVTQNVDNTGVVKDLPFYRYIWDVIKNTTRTERISCAVSILLLFICILLIIYFTVIAKKVKIEEDIAPHEWYITRSDWLANMTVNNTAIDGKYNPLRLVIIAHTAGGGCFTFIDCAAHMRQLQSYYIKTYKYDIPYNFLIGSDGRVYEGRGWNTVGAHLKGYNLCAVGLAFMGDYRYTRLTAAQQWSAHLLFDQGIRMNYLHPDYQVVGAMDLVSTLSPGTNAYNAIKEWSHYAHDNSFKNRTCDQIKEQFDQENNTTTETMPTTNIDISLNTTTAYFT